ncbi:MAG: hypothetical protein ACREQO_17355 [Candidatus Binatia bacterium]
MSVEQSPLFEPVLWQGEGFKILDERAVPECLDYLEVSEVRQALEAVREMKTRAFGQVLTFLYSGALVAQQHENRDVAALRQNLAQMTEQFCAARPTFDFRGLGRYFDEWLSALPTGVDIGATIAGRAREFAKQIVRARQARAQRAAAILPNPARVMTHCNVSGELVAIAHYCRELGTDLTVVATETRPYLQGARLTAWELAQAGVAVSLIPDCAIAQVMARGDVNAVIVGADRVAQNGDIINKVGTYPLALMARDYSVPFHALVQDPRALARGADVPIEERPASELLTFQGRPLTERDSSNITARYPSFDVTPGTLITHLIGFDDVYTLETFRQKYQKREGSEAPMSKPRNRYLVVYGVPLKNQYAYLASALKAESCASVLVPEMRPALWGAHAIAPGLAKRQIPATLISDNMMGTLFAQGEICKLCLYYKGLTDAGPSGICGSLLAVRLARAHGVPIELFGGESQMEKTVDGDVSTFLGEPICPPGVLVRPVKDEIVSWNLFKE